MTKINRTLFTLVRLTLKSKYSKSGGYTLLESLMAIVVVGILIASVAPMLALTTASRVQARRVDQATQALRAYIDGVRGGVIPIPQKFVNTDPNVTFKPANSYGFPPSTSLVNYPFLSDRDPGTLVDTNGNGFDVNDPQDLVIQAIRPISCPRNDTLPDRTPTCAANSAEDLEGARDQGFIMAIRVYRADSFSNIGIGVPKETEQSNIFIGNFGSIGKPLVTSFAEVFPTADFDAIKEKNTGAYGTLTL